METRDIKSIILAGDYLSQEFTVGSDTYFSVKITKIVEHKKTHTEGKWYFEIFSDEVLMATIYGNNHIQVYYL